MKRLGLLILLAATLTGCGGASSGPTGTEAAAPVPAPAPPTRQVIRQYTMVASVGGSRQGTGGCLTIEADAPPSSDTGCGGLNNPPARATGDEGTRGTVTATPDPGYRFIRWSSLSSDCPGESTNPCSFAFDRDKHMIAGFGR